LKPLSDLVDNFRADVGFVCPSRFARGGGAKLRVRSGTMILAPTPQARNFVWAWEAESATAPAGEVDQASLQVALGKQTAATFQNIDHRYCATKRDGHPDPVVLHDQAGHFQGRELAQALVEFDR